jgi:hypothetical protein
MALLQLVRIVIIVIFGWLASQLFLSGEPGTLLWKVEDVYEEAGF